MKSLSQIIFTTILSCLVLSCNEKKTSQPNENTTKWYKGNLHTHTYWSDGDEFPEVVLNWYKSNNYQFLALSDHNTIAEEEKWIQIPKDSIYQNAFKNYLEKYGKEWVTYKIDSGKTSVKLKTYNEYKGLTEEKGKFLVIHSEEITDRYNKHFVHMNATNIQKKIEPQGGNSTLEVIQNNLDAILQQRKETGIPIIPHLNHPNFYYSVTLEDMIALKGERFFEIYNGHPLVHNMGDSTHLATEEMWDLINMAYIKDKKPIMYGTATDDSHHYHIKGNKWSNAGRGWVMVKSDTLSASALIHAMEAGDFYATTGVTLKTLQLKDRELTIEIAEEPTVNYNISFIGCKKGETETKELLKINGIKANYKITDDILFVRCKITSTKLQDNPIEDILYETAWTQPILN
ncbi:histidinol-phosphatase [Gaetbulibacter sp. M235]|uniref:histidinol-phosphatase n=1 Tax=Gaetbulibacter sp. M235 TaxID=3126510 RepID=UPI00374F752F